MSFGTATVDVQLDSTRAEAELTALLSRIAGSDATVVVEVDTRGVASEITAAVDSADSNVVVTSDASEVTGDVTAAVDGADSEVLVTSDASGVTSEVTGAVDAADTDVVVTGQASEVTGEINGAVDAAETEVTVTGDASGVTGAVDAAVDAADGTVLLTGDASGVVGTVEATLAENSPFGPVSVGGEVDPNLLTDVGTLAAGLADASDEGRTFRTVIAGLGAAAAAAGLFQLIDAASEAEQSVGAVEAVFGEASGTITAFADTSAQAAGLTATAAQNLTAQIGALLQGFGFAQDEAAKTSVVIAQLGADLAATFGGTPEEAVQALGAALRGEFDPLERFGISLNVAKANLRAVELGLADNVNAVDANARAQASLSLIMEQSTGAQGQFARELDTTAGQLAVAKAAAQEAAAAVGATLAPAFVELVGVLTDDILPAVEDLGTTLGPALGSAVSATVPILAGAIDVLVALTPIVETFAAVIEAIPDPVLQLIGTFIALRTAIGPLGSLVNLVIKQFAGLSVAAALNVSSLGAIKGAAATAKDGVASLASAITPATAIIAAATIAFTLYSNSQAKQAQNARELESQQQGLSEALNSSEGAIEGLTDRLRDLIDTGAEFSGQGALAALITDGKSFAEVFASAGATVEEFTDAIAQGTDVSDRYLQALTDQGGEAAASSIALSDLRDQIVAQSKASLDAGVATDRWTQSQVDNAIEQTRSADGTRNYVAAQEQLVTETAAAEAAAEEHAAALTEQQKALQELAATAPQVTFLMTALGTETGRTTDLLAALAISSRDAGLSETELQTVLAQLGATSPQAVANLQAVADTIDRVRSAGVNSLPSIQDLAGEFDKFSLQGFRDDLADALEAVQNFNTNLVLIAESGGPRLAAAAAELGPQFAAEIANGIKNGSPGVAQQVELLLAAIEGAGADTENILTTQIGPDLAVATGQMGTLATSAFGENFVLDPSGQIVQLESSLIGGRPGVAFRAMELGTEGTGGFESGLDLAPPTEAEVGAVDTTLEQSGPGTRTRAEELGSTATSGFESGFNPATPARTRVDEARIRIQNAKEGIRGAGSSTGQAGTAGFSSGVSGFGEAGRVAVVQAINTIVRLRDLASSGGRQVGAALGGGITAGIAGQINNIASAARAAVNAALQAAKEEAKIGSPSRVFADEVGSELSAGMALGLEEGTREVMAAAAGVIDRAASQLNVVSRNGLDPQITGLLGELGGHDPRGPGLLLGGGPTVNVTVNAPGATKEDADTIAAATADATVLALERRRLAFSARTAN